MRTTYLLLILLLTLCSCGPENKEVTEEQIETGGRTEVLDSVANTEEDGVTVEVNEDTIDTLSHP